MTDQELILKLKSLKQITPRKDWVVLSKTRMLGVDVAVTQSTSKPVNKGRFLGILENINVLQYRNRLVYSFAALLFLFAGIAGFLKFGLPQIPGSNVKVAQQSANQVASATALKDNVAAFKTKSQNLAQVAKNDPKGALVALKEVKDAAKNLTASIQKDPELAKTIALDVNNNKTQLDISGGNNVSEVTNVYKTIVDQLVKDLSLTTLTDSQKVEFGRIKDSYAKKDANYTVILRDILLINASRDTSDSDSKKK